MDKWKKPSDVNAIDVAFGGRMGDLLPPMAAIPEEFKREFGAARKWTELQSRWFFTGLKGEFVEKDGINKSKALLHLRAIQGSFEPSHEHKQAAVAWLMSLWFDDFVESEAA